MAEDDLLRGKRILVVDDEPEVLGFLEDALEDCIVDTALSFESARNLLDKYPYDAAILDIMGVNGFALLELATKKGILSLMLTAHSLNPDSLVHSIKGGAKSYIPKDKIDEIKIYLGEIFEAKEKGIEKSGIWFARLKSFFDARFGPGWKERDKDFWEDFHKNYRFPKDELRGLFQ
jgi:DNA-binding NtrC family response regulator